MRRISLVEPAGPGREGARPFRAIVLLVALLATVAGCSTGTVLVGGPKFDDRDLVRLVLLDDARQTERQCAAANGVRSSEGCTAAYLRRDGAVGIVAWMTKSLPAEEYRRALPLWCESLAMVQGLARARCASQPPTTEAAVSAQPGGQMRPPVMVAVGPVASGHLFTLVLGGTAGVETSENPVERVRVDLPTGLPEAPGWRVVAQSWCESIAHAEWQMVRTDPCRNGAQLHVNVTPMNDPLGWMPTRVPCVGWVNQFCDPVIIQRR